MELAFREVKSLLSSGLLSPKNAKNICGPAMLMLGPWSWVYHHWIIEDLSRLWALDYFPELQQYPIVVPADLSNFQRESLSAFGIDENRLLCFDGSNWLFERLYFPTFLAPGGHSGQQMSWIRNKLFSAWGIRQKKSGTRRVYVSRADADTRRLINEKEVIKSLESYNFEVVVPGELTLKEQIEIFNETSIICGPSGSGLTNHIFAPLTSTLVELQPDSYVNRAHWYSTNVLNQFYIFLIGRSLTDRHDYSISPRRLCSLIELAIANLTRHDGSASENSYEII